MHVNLNFQKNLVLILSSSPGWQERCSLSPLRPQAHPVTGNALEHLTLPVFISWGLGFASMTQYSIDVLLGIDLMALYMLGKYSPNWATTQPTSPIKKKKNYQFYVLSYILKFK